MPLGLDRELVVRDQQAHAVVALEPARKRRTASSRAVDSGTTSTL